VVARARIRFLVSESSERRWGGDVVRLSWKKGVAAQGIIIVGVVGGKSIVLHFSQADEIAARCSPAVGSKLRAAAFGDVGDARRVGLGGEERSRAVTLSTPSTTSQTQPSAAPVESGITCVK